MKRVSKDLKTQRSHDFNEEGHHRFYIRPWTFTLQELGSLIRSIKLIGHAFQTL